MGEYVHVEPNDRDRANARKLFEEVYLRTPDVKTADYSVLHRLEQAMSNYRAEMEHGFAEASRSTSAYLSKMEPLAQKGSEELAQSVYADTTLRKKLAENLVTMLEAQFLKKYPDTYPEGFDRDECTRDFDRALAAALLEVAEARGQEG